MPAMFNVEKQLAWQEKLCQLSNLFCLVEDGCVLISLVTHIKCPTKLEKTAAFLMTLLIPRQINLLFLYRDVS